MTKPSAETLKLLLERSTKLPTLLTCDCGILIELDSFFESRTMVDQGDICSGVMDAERCDRDLALGHC